MIKLLSGRPRSAAGTSPAMSRRMMLMGAGSFALAIPFLPSLLEGSAKASGAPARPRLFWFGTDHGGGWDTNYYPTTPFSQQATVVSGHTVNAGALAPTTSGGVTSISPVLSASSSTLTSGLAKKMNVLRGLDLPIYLGHNTGLHLGNFTRNDGNSDTSTYRPTIDQILANSPNFYTPTDLAGTTLKSMVINPGRQLSWGFANPSQGVASGVQNVQGLSSSLQLFNAMFGGAEASAMDAGAVRPPVVDKVLANYNSLRQSNTRLSAADKTRLDAHIALLAQLQSTLSAKLSCSTPTKPTDDAQNYPSYPSTPAKAGQLWCDVVAAGFACDASRIGVYGWGDTSALCPAYTGNDWHHEVAHLWDLTAEQKLLTQSYQAFFEQIFMYLATKLDSMEDASGGTVLDNTLMGWSQECCMATHDQFGMQVVTAGGAAGALNTGLYADYRDTSAAPITVTGSNANDNVSYTTYPGLLYSQWLGTALQSMGISPTEYELWKAADGSTEHGYGLPMLDTVDTWDNAYKAWSTHYVSTTGSSATYYNTASNFLPFLKPA